MDLDKLRAWWWHRQGLDGAFTGAAPAEVLARTGWARSVGGVNPYLTLFSRAGAGREAVDADVAAVEIHELPAARGCTYVVPAADYALALQVGRHATEADVRTLAKLGVERAELTKLADAVLEVLGADRALDPLALREELGEAVRHLGEDGRRRGQSTTLPAVLGMLQAAGEIRRVPVDGRLDRQRYAYRRWSAPSTGLDDAAARVELARRYFDWTGAATLAHFRWFSGFGAAVARQAMAALDLVDLGGGLFRPADSSYDSFERAPAPRISLLAGIDGLLLLRRDLGTLLDAPDMIRPLPGGRTGERLGTLADLPDHAIVDRGRLIGLWQFDPGEGEVVWWTFGPAGDAVHEAVARTEEYLRTQVGDARSFSLDSPKSRAPRLAALRAAAR
ncbi:hypothetical protein Val02_16620 [Virgisporangium aliadipatigenens]|uniref:Winged helix DNA-binding domain-containing protein n=1 Tax=Virgisporangium aliadipatigenens TaxID=741659 RepID=A0A8J3YGR4_9ACTN|nr:crosslink repair DNA glycosylase YcaQ family protein [Virgisporangium aliadipatigenens]GIJ44776.1 hypothetical protein Val02_16620 [Virgisporangium aliadipatigenens]